MIKTFLTTIVFFAVFISCHSNSDNKNDPSKQGYEKRISKRDLNINASNAYNDLFFDSMQLVKFIRENKIADSLGRRMISFYNTRNYQFAWFTNNGLTEQALGFWNMLNYQATYGKDSLLNDKILFNKMTRYSEEDSFTVSSTDRNIINTELKLTEHFIMNTLNNTEEGYVKRKEMERFIPLKKEDPLKLADSLLTKKHKDNKYYEDINNSYKLLKEQLGKYYAIARQGGWAEIKVPAKQIKKGASSAAVILLKKRLQLTGDMNADSTAIFNDALVSGIKNVQLRFGYTPNGILTDGLLKDLNVPVIYRIQQLLINMGRMQWMINEPVGQMIVVNIPEFILHVKDGTKKVFDMNVVVGKEGHNTMMFTGNLNQIVFSPYWNVPSSIVKKEIMPAMQSKRNYLSSHHMEVTGYDNGLPVIRQLPGKDNSLGKVKFLFPNSFNIYFHDTPVKSLFEKDKRAYSHGCIRLSDPVKMANYLLKEDARWNPENIDSAMNNGKEKYVKLKTPVPVLITYYTAWVDDQGLLHFADDIYGHDKRLVEKMFVNP
jgi:murein L,D-transpeptidase YcbB/YkuD